KFLILIMGIVLMFSNVFVYAEDDDGFEVYNTRLITNNKEATFVEGSVAKAQGQEVLLKHRLKTIAKKQMPNTGRETNFKLKVPAKYVEDGKVSILNVIEKGDGYKNRARVEVEYVERKQQEIESGQKVSMTFPGLDAKIKAKSTSGEPLSYVSNDPKIASVDSKGNIVPKGEGETTITIKQIGNGAYEETQKDVKVSVKAIDAYTVTYHSTNADGETEVKRQIIETGDTVDLEANPFKNGDHEFLGWATSEEDFASYLDQAEVSDLGKKGDNVDLYAVWSGDGVRAAISWAIKIAADDSFSYGKKPQTSKVGCYFCGTNCGPVKYRKPKGYEKTYVCMTFVHAAYAHGAEDPEILRECQTGSNCLALENTNFTHYHCWDKVGLCRNLSINDLEPGDVIVWYAADNNSGHMSMYMGDNTIVDCTSSVSNVWGPDAIAVRPGKGTAYLNMGARSSSQSYVMRYHRPS
ncbi:MAG: InlB B-repeat-containing protein, partial [Mogibacterium sp.]|nr:InlB B-repeat-containing protein [Mogibacterium sp.]